MQVYYEVLGFGEPILIAHGWGGSSESLRPLGLLLSVTNKVILVDLPGFGKSENPKENWGVEEYSDILIELLENLKIKKVIYFGHSFGGGLGLILSATNKRLVTKLILCNTALKRVNKKSRVPLFIKSILFRQKNLRIWLYRIFFPNSDISKQPHLETNFKIIMSQDLSNYPAEITQPTLILWGEKDEITPLEWAKELHEKIKNSTLKIILGARHGLPLRSPGVVADEVLKFIYS